MNTYIFAISNKKFGHKLISVEADNREESYVLAKSKVFPELLTKGKSILEIHDMFFEMGYWFEQSMLIEGDDYEITEFKK
ncbi:MAG: hypothetical protein SLAVMIC_00816 [uncultured marine phage]|uniref:Uncharacterized protein n=1 Tax=uncultured marine phage TaxID=707152 RepID=A0A8D9CFS8_9VIRU|nr:MAG: hypothetical protein SLAVMIC_00816 [uncultured marine phage]